VQAFRTGWNSATDLRNQAIKVLPSLYYKVAAIDYTGNKPTPEIILDAKKLLLLL